MLWNARGRAQTMDAASFVLGWQNFDRAAVNFQLSIINYQLLLRWLRLRRLDGKRQLAVLLGHIDLATVS